MTLMERVKKGLDSFVFNMRKLFSGMGSFFKKLFGGKGKAGAGSGDVQSDDLPPLERINSSESDGPPELEREMPELALDSRAKGPEGITRRAIRPEEMSDDYSEPDNAAQGITRRAIRPEEMTDEYSDTEEFSPAGKRVDNLEELDRWTKSAAFKDGAVDRFTGGDDPAVERANLDSRPEKVGDKVTLESRDTDTAPDWYGGDSYSSGSSKYDTVDRSPENAGNTSESESYDSDPAGRVLRGGAKYTPFANLKNSMERNRDRVKQKGPRDGGRK